MPETEFDPQVFLGTAGVGRKLVQIKAGHPFFSQDDDANCIFFVHKGRVKVTVVSTAGKEATVALIGPGEFLGEESVVALPGLRTATATAITSCAAMKLQRREMIRA